MARPLTRRIDRVLMISAIRWSPHRVVRRLGNLRNGAMGWRATDPSENDAHQQAADLNVIFNQYGQRNEEDHREVDPPIEAPTWFDRSAARRLDQ
jgi:hypothetical protein